MKLLKQININSILFLDIETAPKWEKFEDVPENVRKEWFYKWKFKDNAPKFPSIEENQNNASEHIQKKYIEHFDELWNRQAGLFPEFSRIVCISAGYIVGSTLRIKSYFDDNEADLLKRFSSDVNQFHGLDSNLKLCGHYAKGFDYPFIVKRMLIHRMNIPNIMDVVFLKPWDIKNLDTQEIWKLGGFSSGTLSSIAMVFGLPTPKDDIEGSDVSRYYHNGEIARIVSYCEKDVVTLVNIFKCMRGEEIINDLQVEKAVL